METEQQAAVQARFEQASAFLGVHPAAIMDDIVNAAHSYLCDGIDALERALLEELPKDIDAERITKVVDGIHARIRARMEKRLDHVEVYSYANLLLIPEGLTEQQKSVQDPDVEDESRLDKEYAELVGRMRIARDVERHLASQLAVLDADADNVKVLDAAAREFCHLLPDVQAKLMQVEDDVRSYVSMVQEVAHSAPAQTIPKKLGVPSADIAELAAALRS
ncbi:Protein MIS12 like protein [Plasmodiophora brassicae]|nr:hypothetical protein PBRA_003915 [Plasmodiophora brassicae]